MPMRLSRFSQRSVWMAVSTAALVMLVALLSVVEPISTSLSKWVDPNPPSPSWIGVDPSLSVRTGKQAYDIDTHLIHGGLVQAPRFVDTLRWWHGTWAGQVPFYRPLTSMLFWIEWKAWGDRETRYQIVGPCIHVVAVGSLFFLAFALYRRFNVPWPLATATFSSVVFSGVLGLISSQPSIISETTEFWKNQPDCLTLLWFSLCLTSTLRDQDRDRVSATPLVFYLLLCLTKEAGIFLPLLLPLLEVRRWKIAVNDKSWQRMAPLLATLPIYLMLRAAFLHDAIGYRYGSNSGWTYRLTQNLLGPITEAIVLRQWLLLAICGYLLFAGIVFLRQSLNTTGRPRDGQGLRIGLVLLGLPIVAVAADFPDTRSVDLISLILRMAEFDRARQLLQMAAFSICFLSLAVKRPRLMAVLYGWVLLSVALTLFSPSVLHRYYLVNASFALIMGGGASFALEFAVRRFRKRSSANLEAT